MFPLRLLRTAKCVRNIASVVMNPVRMASSNPKYINAEEPYDEFKQRFLEGFNRTDIDGWWMRKYLQDLHTEDIIPEPEIIVSALKACRRINDFALAVRYLESLRQKCEIKADLFPWLMKEVSPAMKELGIPTLEELNYDQPELYTLDYDD